MSPNTKNRLSISEARRMLTELINLTAYQGREFTITRNGKPMARIVPLSEEQTDFQKQVRATIADSKDILRELE